VRRWKMNAMLDPRMVAARIQGPFAFIDGTVVNVALAALQSSMRATLADVRVAMGLAIASSLTAGALIVTKE
jgi:hypothetical protein